MRFPPRLCGLNAGAARKEVPNVKHLVIKLSDELYDELVITAADSSELDEPDVCSPEQYAAECIEAVLATRRFERITA
jgi:hypothetical protein